jgi:hypothetical protein
MRQSLRWRALSGLLLLFLLIIGVLNFALLHSLSYELAPELDLHYGARRHPDAHRREHPPIRHTDTKGRAAHRVGADVTGTAVIFPAAPGDRTTAGVALVLRECGFKPDFCRNDLPSCIARQRRGRTDLVWLKTEGSAGQVPEQALNGAAAVNSFGVGWKIWSRRSLCLALNRNRQALRSASLASWYPDCYTLPLQQAQAAQLRSDQAPGDGMWIVHTSSGSSILQSGQEAAQARGTGVMQRYISPPLTLQGFKFSLLLYVAVTSISPLRAWIYHDGHVLVATKTYARGASGVDEEPSHVTHLDRPTGPLQTLRGRSGLLHHLAASSNQDEFWSKVEGAIALAVLSAVSQLKVRSTSASPALHESTSAHPALNESPRCLE